MKRNNQKRIESNWIESDLMESKLNGTENKNGTKIVWKKMVQLNLNELKLKFSFQREISLWFYF